MSRRIIIDKYQGNTHYNVKVIDSYGQEHHVGYFDEMDNFSQSIIENEAETIWSNEVKNETTPIEKAIKWCVDNDISKGREPSLD